MMHDVREVLKARATHNDPKKTVGKAFNAPVCYGFVQVSGQSGVESKTAALNPCASMEYICKFALCQAAQNS